MRTVVILSLCLSMTGLARAQQAPPAPAGQLEEVEIPNPPKKWAYAFGGAALGLWLVAAGTGGGALALSSAQEGNVASPMPYTQGLADEVNSGKTLAAVAYAFIGLAGIVTIVDAVLWYECFRRPRKEAPQKSAARVQFIGNGVRF